MIKQYLFNFPELEWILSETGAIKTDIERDPRPKIRDALFSQLNGNNGSNSRPIGDRSDESDDDY